MIFCLLHGRWGDSSCWSEVPALLRMAEHVVVAPDLPLSDPAATYGERIQPALEGIGDSPAVVVGHSLGAAYAPLVARARPGSTLIYLCPAPVLPLRSDDSPRAIRPSFPFPPVSPDGVSVWQRQAALDAMFQRVPRAKALAAVERLKPDVPARGDYPLRDHPEIPSALIYATDDEFFEPDWERWTARNVLHTDPVEIPGGHFPMLADPEMLSELLVAVAETL